MKKVRPFLVFVLPLLCLIAGSRIAAAADFPPVTDAERALAAVPGEPNAPAAVLFKKGELLMMGYGAEGAGLSSSLRIQARVKVLTEEGKSNGEIAIGHSDFERLQGFAGRTIQPDGRVIPLPADAKFVRRTSRSNNYYTTAVAFPAVEVGSIIDYAYEVKFDSIYFLEPWYFSEDLPVLHSEITFKVPIDVQAQTWIRDPFRVGVQKESKQSSRGTELRAWAKNVPSVPSDPYGPPYADLATQMMLLPTALSNDFMHERLLESWASTCDLVGQSYEPVRRRDGGVAKKAREIAASGGPREKAEALYRFVRDEIASSPFIGVLVSQDSSLDKVLNRREGDRAEKALLLQAMLKAVKVDSRLVWAGDRNRGPIDPQLANPNWFDTILVMVELDGRRVFLDPSDRALGFGQLRHGYEGTPALIHDRKKPEGLVLPETPYDQNVQRAEIDLALDESGRLAGAGTLTLTGHHAWQRIDWQEDEARTLQAWKDWLGERYKGFEVSDVKVIESPDERKVTLTWAVAEREEEVLGDEATVVPSLPLGPLAQPFVQAAGARRSAVMFDFPDRDEVELRLRWPEGWTVESFPKAAKVDSAVGALASGAEIKEGERSLVYRRRLDLTRRVLASPQEYEAVRSLFGEVEKSDAQALLLVRR